MSLSTENFPPNITAPGVFMATVGSNSTYSFMVTESTSVDIMLNGQFDLPSNVYLTNTSNEDYVLTWMPIDMAEELTLTIVARGSRNVSSMFSPRVQLCGCVNNGICTTAGVLNLQHSFILLSCACPPGICSLFVIQVLFYYIIAYDGDFCENDADGCAVTSCLEGQMCTDNPAPMSGAQCTCPDGYITIDSKCGGMYCV